MSPSGCFIADNVIDDSATPTGFDQYGLLFSKDQWSHEAIEFNVFSDPANGGTLATLFSDDCHTTHDSPTATPEPSSMAIAGVALSCLLAGYLRRRYHA